MTWLDDATATVKADPAKIRTLFAMAGRKVGDGANHARLQLLQALGDHLNDELADLYRFGDANERIAILLALPELDSGGVGMVIVRDALRTNDVRLVMAALNQYSYEQLGASEMDHAVMKCVFMDVPLESVPGLVDQARQSTATMLRDFALERTVAGRDVQPAVWTIINRFGIDTSEIEATKRKKKGKGS